MIQEKLTSWAVLPSLLLAMCVLVGGCSQTATIEPSTELLTVSQDQTEPTAPASEEKPAAQEPDRKKADEPAGSVASADKARGCARPKIIRGSGTAETIGEGADTITLVKIQGNRYELGYWYGKLLADPNAKDPKARLLLTSSTRFDEYADNQSVDPHPCEDLEPFHESLDDIVYWKNHNGKNNEVLFNAIQERYGEIDARKAIEIAQAACVDGTLVSIIYHNSGGAMWVAIAEGLTPGPHRQYMQVKLDD